MKKKKKDKKYCECPRYPYDAFFARDGKCKRCGKEIRNVK